MPSKDKRNMGIIISLKEIYEDISKSKDDSKALSCDGWINQYNEIIQRLKEINKDDNQLSGILKEDFKTMLTTRCSLDTPHRWTKGIQSVNQLKYKIKELLGYLESPIEYENKNTPKSVLDLNEVIEHKGLIKACEISFKGNDYWDSCLHAFRHLETKIREKCGLTSEEHGVDLVNKAFKVDNGILKIPCCATTSEEKGFQLLNMGIVMFHRNAKGHREEIMGKNDAFKIICYVDYLLGLLDTAVPRNRQN